MLSSKRAASNSGMEYSWPEYLATTVSTGMSLPNGCWVWGVGAGVPGSGLQMACMWYARGTHAVSTGCGALCGTERGTRTRNAPGLHTSTRVCVCVRTS